MPTKSSDKLTPELRTAEAELDSYYRSNPLAKLQFASAAWYLLAFGEEMVIWPIIKAEQSSMQEQAVKADSLVNEINYPLRWLHESCSPGEGVPFSYDVDNYVAARNLLEMAYDYGPFVTAFTYASREWIGLSLQDRIIYPTDNLYTNAEYEAYDWLTKPYESPIDIDQLPTDEILRTLKIQNDRFTYKINPRIVADTIQAWKPEFDRKFTLPADWEFSQYTLGEFRRVFEAIAAVAYLRFMARLMAASRGCVGLGYVDSIYVPTIGELQRRIVRYSDVSKDKVLNILNDLTYGNREIRNPDPALQPLIRLNSNVYAIMPSLWRYSAAERNLVVLLNRLRSERNIYLRLVSEKEILMRKRIESRLSDTGFRVVYGSVPDLPDVDLALIDDTEKVCLLLELKWFIYPAEVREIIEKSAEIKKGISQSLQLTEAFRDNNKQLLGKLMVDSSYEVLGVVVSANSIGHASVQSPKVPVIMEDHLVAKLETTPSLRTVIKWLSNREFLPIEGKHFEVEKNTVKMGDWELQWYGIKPLIEGAFISV